MAKKKATDKLDVKMDIDKASVEVQKAIYSFQNIQPGLSVSDIIDAAEIIKAECGDNAIVEVNYDDYWGTSINLSWWRKETDEEVEKRIEKNKKTRKTAAVNRKKAKEKKADDEKAELARLKALYPNES